MPPSSYTEAIAERFYTFERVGRGKLLSPSPVSLEPPFAPFTWERSRPSELDDARHDTPLSWLKGLVLGRAKVLPAEDEADPQPLPHRETERSDVRLFLPRDLKVTPEASLGFLRALLVLRHPFSFELVTTEGAIRYFASLHPGDRAALQAAAGAFLPGVALRDEAPLRERWGKGSESLFLEFALAREWMIPLTLSLKPDPLVSILSLFSQVARDEGLALQTIFVPTRERWRESALRAVRTPAGSPIFADAPDLFRRTEEKVSSPLFAVALRLAVSAPDRSRRCELARLVGGALSTMGSENELLPLTDNRDAEEDFLLRRSHRSGMLLSLPELAALVHFPGEEVRLPAIERGTRKEKEPPHEALRGGVLLGEACFEGRQIKVSLPEVARLRHTHLIGATGTGKSTLLRNLILEDIRAGRGVGLIDPHGDLSREVLARIPEERLPDLTLLDPSEREISSGWSVLEAHDDAEREVLASDLSSLFRRYSTTWGDQLQTLLSTSLAALLSLPGPFTISDLRRFLVDRPWRESLIPTIPDEEVRFFFEKELPHIGERSMGPILGRLNTFLRSRAIRETISRPGGIDFRALVDRGGILIARLPQGTLGEETVSVLGSLVVSRLHQVALSRASLPEGARRPFFLFLDELQLFKTPSIALLLSGARKFGLALTLAHQSLQGLGSPEIESSLLANAYTRVVFKVGEQDARKLSQGFSTFAEEDLLSLKTGEAVARLGANEADFLFKVPRVDLLSTEEEETGGERTRAFLRERFVPRTEVVAPPPHEPAAVSRPEKQEGREEGGERKPSTSSATSLARKPRKAVRSEALGRGGSEHLYFQELIKRCAEGKGYRATIEEQVLGGSVDVGLTRGVERIAVEISVTTSADHELGNVRKCLAAGFTRVVVIVPEGRKRKKLASALSALSSEEREQVECQTPEEFLASLEEPAVEEQTVGGYRVKVAYRGETGDGSKGVAQVIARSLQRLQTKVK